MGLYVQLYWIQVPSKNNMWGVIIPPTLNIRPQSSLIIGII